MHCYNSYSVIIQFLIGILFIPFITALIVNAQTNDNKLVIDTDGGSDDSMAIFIALLTEKYFNGPQVVAITTVNGNVDEPQVYKNVQRILDITERREIPIYRGAAHALVEGYPTDAYFGKDGLGDTSYHSVYDAIAAQELQAASALLALSKQYQGNLTVITLGPLSNIALAVRIDPQFISRLKQLHVGAGHIQDDTHTRPEFNALLDVEGYFVAVENAVPDIVTTVPYSRIGDTVHITTDWRVNTLGKIDTEIMRCQNAFEDKILNGTTSWNLLDPSVVSAYVNTSIVEQYVYTNTSIILCGDKRGINTNEIGEKDKSNVRAVYSVSTEKYQQFLLDVFSAK